MKKKLMILILIIITVPVTYSTVYGSKVVVNDYTEVETTTDHSGSVYDLSSGELVYEEYIEFYPQSFPDETVVFDFVESLSEVSYVCDDEYCDGEKIEVQNYQDSDSTYSQNGLFVPEMGSISFVVDVVESGYYNLSLEYYNVTGRGSSIERNIYVNGVIPFEEANDLVFSRYWADEFDVSDKREDDQHDYKPQQIEVNRWSSVYIDSYEGLYSNPYYFYFEEGKNTIQMDSLKESVVFKSLTLNHCDEYSSYDNYLQTKVDSGVKVIDSDYSVKQQGESTLYKSSPTITPQADYSSSKTEPYEMNYTRYNNIGGTSWRMPGDFITWEVTVEEAGLYEVTLKVLQNLVRGMNTNRKLLINGEVPFDEVSNIVIPYNSSWQNYTIANEDGEAYLIYFEEGVNTITLEGTVGIYQDIIRDCEQIVSDLRDLYREVVMRTGLSPSEYQDYLLEEYIDDFYLRIDTAKADLENSRLEFIEIAGEKTSLLTTFDKLIVQLEDFSENEKNLQNDLTAFESNISSLGTFVLSLSEQTLSVDYFIVGGTEAEIPKASSNFFESVYHEIILFFASFSSSSSLDGSYKVDGPTITVWTSTGRDQAMVIRQLIDESFTREYNINVELKLVSSSVLLPATVSGNGPDVAIGVGESTPVNWGIRNAIVDLTQFSDYEEFSQNFHESAIEPYSFNGATYALPDTQDFYMTFYRNDILEEMGMTDIPQTWDEVVSLLPQLQKSYMEYYIPTAQATLSPVLYSMINQYGGSLYSDDGSVSNLMDPNSTEAFVDFTRLFSDYGLSLNLNFLNRFRSGEAPFGISTFNGMYNQLAVFAPEISNEWSFGAIPGVMDEDGNINNVTTAVTTSSIIMEDSSEQDASWEFLKWWLGDETQLTYARNMESILGAAARYATANLNAFSQLSWTTKEYHLIEESRDNAKCVPVVPGDYIVGRYIDNAFRSSVNDGVNPFDSLYKYHIQINEELTRKREEFGL